jgi:hypothetical protein
VSVHFDESFTCRVCGREVLGSACVCSTMPSYGAYAAGLRLDAQDQNEGRENHSYLYYRRCFNCGRDVHISSLEDGWCPSCRGETSDPPDPEVWRRLHIETAEMLRGYAERETSPILRKLYCASATDHERLGRR